MRERAPDQSRWSRALAGALLAGGGVFALGQFVMADGNMRETGFPMRASVPIAEPVAPAPPARVQPRPAAQPKPLPYLALVRDIAPEPAKPRAVRTLSAAIDSATPTAAVPAPEATQEESGDDAPALVADLAPQPLPPAPSGLRRDLEGFLEAQGHELAVPDSPGALAASSGALPPAPALAASLAEVERPVAESAMIEAVSAPPDTAPALAEVRELTPSPTATPTQRLAEVEPATTLAGTAEAMTRSEVPPSVAVIPPPRSDATAPSARGAVQSYPLAVVNGEPLGAVTLRDSGASEPAIHLGALLALVKLRMPEAEFTRLSGAAAADRFVTLDELRAAGIAVQFDARENRLVIGAR